MIVAYRVMPRGPGLITLADEDDTFPHKPLTPSDCDWMIPNLVNPYAEQVRPEARRRQTAA